MRMKNNTNFWFFTLLSALAISLSSCCSLCKTHATVETNTEVDTIIVHDTIEMSINIPADTVYVYDTIIKVSEQLITNLRENKLNLGPWYAESSRSKAEAGIKNNIPYLYLYNKGLDTTLTAPVDHLNIIETNTTTESSVIEKPIEVYPKFYKNIWFYICSCISLLFIIFLSRSAGSRR